jgi:hypothetical protein
MRSAERFGLAALALACLGSVIATGCGGGSGSLTTTRKVTAQTRTRVSQVETQFVRALVQSGVQTAAVAAKRNGSYANGSFPTPPAGFGGVGFTGVTGYTAAVGAPAQYIPPMPMLGAFIHNVAANSKSGRAVMISNMAAHRGAGKLITRDDPPPPPPTGSGSGSGSSGSGGPAIPPVAPTFYFDEFLGLWVDIQDTATQSTYTLYVDEAKTQPAGSIVTTIPSGTTYPQTFASTYNFTAGVLAGSHGSYQTTVNQDGSGSSSYTDTYTDGSKDSGQSSWTVAGGFTWTDQSTDSTGAQTTSSGAFHSDGSGATHSTTSDGYTIDYTYNADGTGSGKISGPAAGLPANITSDVYGDITITYADGTVDSIPGWTVVPVTGTNPGGSTPPAPPVTPITTPDTPPAPPTISNSGTPPPPPGH